MQRILYYCLFLFSLITGAYTRSDLSQMIDEMKNKYMADDLFAGVVLVSRQDTIVYHKAFGFLDREQKSVHTIDSQLKIGSIVKDFTAVVILQLVEEGKLNLDDQIGKYIDFFESEILHQVTIRQLLRHQSGFGDYLMLPQTRDKIKAIKTVNGLIELFKNEPLLFEPGADERYSNSGYTVLGAIIEDVTQLSYFDAIDHYILQPLNMNNTLFNWQKIDSLSNHPKWYMRSATGNFFESDIDEWPSPSGGAYSTVADLLKFEYSLTYDNRLLSDKSKLLKANRFEKTGYTSWSELIANKSTIIGKAGGSPGNNSVIINFPSQGYIIIVLANYDEPIAEQIGQNIVSIIRLKRYKPPQVSIFEAAYNLYRQEGIDRLKSDFLNLINEYQFQDDKDFVLNRVGYDLITESRLQEALDIFNANTELYPQVANTWDSLGEIYLLLDKYELAEKYYRKSLELNPENQNAVRMLQKIQH